MSLNFFGVLYPYTKEVVRARTDQTVSESLTKSVGVWPVMTEVHGGVAPFYETPCSWKVVFQSSDPGTNV